MTPSTGNRARLFEPVGRRHRAFGGAAVTLLAILILGALAPGASAKDGTVTVRAAGTTNSSVTIRLSDLGGNDINNRPYRLNSGTATISGHSLEQVMKAADEQSEDIDLATIPAVEIDRPRGGTVRITRDEILNDSAFSDGPPVFYEDNGDTVFVMPGRGTGVGSQYRFRLAPVGITVDSGSSFDVRLTASQTKVKVGQQVAFTATVSGQEGGESLTFNWSFGDGSSRTTAAPRVSHTFRKDGAFSVIVNVTGQSGSGQTGIRVEVGEVKEAKPRPAPNESGGPATDNADANGGTGGSGGGSGGFGQGFGGGSGSFGTGTGSGPATGSTPGTPAPAAPEPAPGADPADGLEQVQGQLVDPVTGEVVPPASAEVVESADPAPSGTEQGGFGVPGAAWTLAGVGLLIGLGAFAELRVFSRLY
jgi:PKD repeat protein